MMVYVLLGCSSLYQEANHPVRLVVRKKNNIVSQRLFCHTKYTFSPLFSVLWSLASEPSKGG